MPLVIPNGFAQVAYQFSVEGDAEVMVSTVGVDFGAMAGGDQENADAVADGFIDAWPVGSLAVGWRYLGVICRVGIAGGEVVTIESPRVHVGTANAETLPQNCATLIRKTTLVAGRRGRGRFYLPPMTMSEFAISKAGVIASTSLAAMQAAANAWFNHGEPFVLLHGNTPSVMAPTPITSFVVDARIATQRRRLRR